MNKDGFSQESDLSAWNYDQSPDQIAGSRADHSLPFNPTSSPLEENLPTSQTPPKPDSQQFSSVSSFPSIRPRQHTLYALYLDGQLEAEWENQESKEIMRERFSLVLWEKEDLNLGDCLLWLCKFPESHGNEFKVCWHERGTMFDRQRTEMKTRTIELRHDCHFLFSLQFVKGHSSRRILSDATEIVYFSLYFFRTNEYDTCISQMVEQWIRGSDDALPIRCNNEYKGLLQQIDVVLCSGKPEFNSVLAFYVFVITGLFDIRKISTDFTMESTPTLLALAQSEFTSMLNMRLDFQSFAIRGLGHQLLINCTQGKTQWSEFLSSISDSPWLQCLLEDLSEREAFQDGTQAAFCGEMMVSNVKKLESYRKVIDNIKNLEVVLKLMTELPEAELERNESIYVAAVNRCCEVHFSREHVLVLISAFHVHADKFSEVFHKSNISAHLTKFLKDISMKKEDNLPLFIEFFVKTKSQRLLPGFKVEQYLFDLVLEADLPISQVVSSLLVPLKMNAVTLFSKWLNRVSTQLQVKEFIQVLDSELSALSPFQDTIEVCSLAIRVIKTKSKSQYKWVINLVDAFQSVQVLELQKEYVTWCKDEVGRYKPHNRSDHESLDSALLQLLQNVDKAVTEQLDLSNVSLSREISVFIMETYPPIQDSDVLDKLLSRPSAEGFWGLMLKHSQLFAGVKYVEHVINVLKKLRTAISTQEIKIESVVRIKNMSIEERKVLIHFLAIASLEDVKDALSMALAKLNEHETAITTVQTFFFYLKTDSIQCDSSESEFKQFMNKFPSEQLTNFAFPVQLRPLISAAQRIVPLCSSQIYHHFLKLERNKVHSSKTSTTFSLSGAEEVCQKALETMQSSLLSIFINMHSVELHKVTKLFEQVENVLEETQALKTINPDYSQELDQLRECMQLYVNTESLEDICQVLLRSSHLGILLDSEVLSQCRLYCSLKDRKNTISLQDFVIISQCTDSMLFPTSEKSVLQSGFRFLKSLFKSQAFFDFLEGLSPETISKLKNSGEQDEKSRAYWKAVDDLDRVSQFLAGIREPPKPYSEFCTTLLSLVTESQLQGLEISLLSAAEHLTTFLQVLEIQRKEEAKSSHLDAMCRQSELAVTRDEQTLEIRLKFSTNSSHYLDQAEIAELKDRGDMIQLSIQGSLSEENPDPNYQDFSALAVVAEDIQKCLSELTAYGYPNEEIEERKVLIENGDTREAEAYSTALRRCLEDWKKALRSVYESNFCMTHFHGHQFWVLESYLILGTEASDQHQAEMLLTYAGLSSVHKKLGSKLVQSPQERLLRVAGVFKDRKPSHPQGIPLHYDTPVGAKIVLSPGSVLYADSKNVLMALVSVYIHSSGILPKPYQVLWCRRETQWVELMAFLYRCFTSQNPMTLYSLVECEKLTMECQSSFQELFSFLCGSGVGNGQFAMAIITSDVSCVLSDFFKNSQTVVKIRDAQLITDSLKLAQVINSDLFTWVVTSAGAGCGKTSWINRKAEELTRPISVLRINGKFDLKQICKELNTSMDETKVLHVVLGLTDNPQAVNEVICSLSLFRSLSCGDMRVCFSFCYIFIEIANLQPDLMTEIPHLQLLSRVQVEFLVSEIAESDDLRRITPYLLLLLNGGIDSVDPSTIAYSHDIAKVQIQRHFVDKQRSRYQPVSYRNLFTFTKLLSTLLQHFEKSPFTRSYISELCSELQNRGLTQVAEQCKSLRSNFVYWLIRATEEVNTMAVSSTTAQQKQGEHAEKYCQQVMYEASNHFVTLFLPDGSLVPIYRNVEMVPPLINQLIFLQRQLSITSSNFLTRFFRTRSLVKAVERSEGQIEDYSNMTGQALLQKLKSVLTNIIPQEYAQEPIDPGFNDYVMTPDNFLKMMLIYLRVMANLPVVIMGETGCGKTYLIRFFVTQILKSMLKVINIHPGVTASDLQAIMEEVFLLANSAPGSSFWVFFDEFNTSICVGQISDLLCERQFDGVEIPKNVVLVAACNPYRRKPAAYMQQDVGIQRRGKPSSPSNLVHMVNPLPDAVIDYIWDFGALRDLDVTQYISAMLIKSKLKTGLLELSTKMVYAAHQYFREEEVSNVSLRDVSRFLILLEWFRKSISLRNRNWNERYYRNLLTYYNLERIWPVPLDIDELAVILAFSNTYLLRIPKFSDRETFLRLVATAAKSLSEETAFLETIKSALQNNERDLIARLEIPPGIAINQALSENLVTLIHCVFSKTPVIICGKPGCSKSLAIQILLQSCKGKESLDPYFGSLPALESVPFQGSESCTSEGVEQVFRRAQARIDPSEKVLPVVVFDEIGSAELSKHNPLKALHSLLEVENQLVGFVGVTNWRLDSSKMNRVLYLARPDPDENDLVKTAETIYFATGGKKEKLGIVIALAKAYFSFKQKMGKISGAADYYGLRDFYHLIEHASKSIRNVSAVMQETLKNLAIDSINRNFGGYRNALESFKEEFDLFLNDSLKSLNAQSMSALELMEANLKDADARYLMLISKGEVGLFVLETKLGALFDRHRMFIGSQLPKDLQQEEYAHQSLKQIVFCMEQGISITLKDMNHVYSGLYDLFNQNYTVLGGRKFCTVALGATFMPQCLVHPQFRVVVFMSDDEAVLQQTDPPFLNRFEKQRLDLDSMLSTAQLKAVHRLEEWVNQLVTVNGQETAALVDRRVLFPLYSNEYLKLLVLDQRDERMCKEEMLRTAPMDVMVLADISVLEQEEKEFLKSTWTQHHESSFADILRTHLVTSQPSPNILVFTCDSELLHSESVPGISIVIRHFSAFESERDLAQSLASFYRDERLQVYIIDFNLSTDSLHMNWLKFMVNKMRNEFARKNKGKSVCVLVRMQRNGKYASEVWWFHDWDVYSCDNLSAQSICSLSILDQDTRSLIIENQQFEFEKEVSSLISDAYDKIDLRSFQPEMTDLLTLHRSTLIEKVPKSEKLTEAFKRKVFAIIQDSSWTLRDWRLEIFFNSTCATTSKDLKTAIHKALEEQVKLAYTSIVFTLEKTLAFHSFFGEFQHQKLLQTIWLEAFERLKVIGSIQTLAQSNVLEVEYFLSFPFSYTGMQKLEELYQNYTVERLSNPGEAKNNFLSVLRRGTVLGSSLEAINSASVLHKTYIRDLVTVDFAPRFQSHSQETVTLKLHQMLSAEVPDLESKICSYFLNKKLVQVIYEVLMQCQELSEEDIFPEVLTELSGIEFKEEDDYGESQDFQDVEITSSASTTLSSFIQNYVLRFQPSPEIFKHTSGMEKYGKVVSNLFQLMKTLMNEFPLHFSKLAILDFWNLMVSCACRLGMQEKGVLGVANQAAFTTREEELFVYDRRFMETVLVIIAQHSIGFPRELSRFKLAYFGILLNKNEETIQLIAGEINALEDVSFTSIVTRIIRKCQLDPVTDALSALIRTGDLSAESDIDYLNALEDTLAHFGLTCKFAVILSDCFLRDFERRAEETESARNYLEVYENEFRFFSEQQFPLSSQYPNLRSIILLASVRVFLDQYCSLLLRCNGLDSECGIAKNVSEFLNSDRSLTNTLRMYCLKAIKRIGPLSNTGLQQILKNIEIHHWKLDSTLVPGENSYAPLRLLGQNLYQVVFHKLGSVLDSQPQLDFQQEIDSIDSPERRIQFAVGVMMQFFYAHVEGKQLTQADSWLLTVESLLRRKLGPGLFHLIRLFKDNFPQNSFLRITPESSQTQRALIQAVCLFLITFLAHSDKESPMTSIFFDGSGNLHPNLVEHFNAAFIYGTESNPLYSELKFIDENFDFLKFDAWKNWKNRLVKGSAYKCSETCDYLYFIPNCGAPLKKSTCPYCRSAIGGTNHLPVKRKGHINLSDPEAKEFVKEAIERYKSSEQAGYYAYGTDSAYIQPVRGTSTTGFRVLHSFINSSIYFLLVSGLVSETTIRQIVQFPESNVNLEHYFSNTIESDFYSLVFLPREELCQWVEVIIAKLPDFLRKCTSFPSNLEIRYRFEADFDKEIVEPRTVIPQRDVTEYKQSCRKNESGWVALVEEIRKNVESYPLFELFRVTEKPSWSRMCTYFEVRRLKEQHKLLDLYIQNRADFRKLRCFSPLIDLTNYLLHKFNHVIARDEAKNKRMREVLWEDKQGKELFTRFLEVWEKIEPLNLQYTCKELSWKTFSEEDELAFFLVDNKEFGGGLYVTAALIDLSTIQNKLLNICQEHMETTGSKHLYPVQKVKENMLLDLDLESPAVFQMCCMNNSEYGRGKEVSYDFEALEQILIEKVSKAKFLSFDQLHFVQYTFELQNLDGEYSSIISEIRKKVTQKTLNAEISRIITLSLSTIQKRSESNYPTELRSIYNSLEYLLCYLKTSHLDSDARILDLVSRVDSTKVHQLFKVQNQVSELLLESIVCVYEEVETRYFPYLRDFVHPEFNSKDAQSEVETIVGLLMNKIEQKLLSDDSSLKSHLDLTIIKTAVMRMISRCLTGNVRPEHSIELYITRPDFWPEDSNEDLMFMVAQALSRLCLRDSLLLHDVLKAKVAAMLERSRRDF